MPSEIAVQFFAQCDAVEPALQHAVDLGHLLAFELHPAFLLEVIQRLDYPTALGLMLLVQRLEIHRGPGPGAAGGLDDRSDKIPALAFETRQ
ncbi:hypothetical protein D3C81_1681690 [compost metagenome]